LTERLPVTLSDPPSARIWVGFSGGLDSTVLLHWLQKNLPSGFCLQAIHIHHGLNPAADAWTAHCQTVCDALGIVLYIERITIANVTRNIEAQARAARYAAFARHVNAGDTLALAHHADDVAETLLLRLMRGSGTEALGNMKAHSRYGEMQIWRPLLTMRRADLLAYAETNALQWIEDASNADTGFDRNFVRSEVLPLLESRFPNATARLARSAALMQADAVLLQPMIADQLARCTGPQGLQLAILMAQTLELQGHLLRAWLHDNGLAAPGAEALQEFLRQLNSHETDDDTLLDGPDYAIQVWDSTLMLRTKTATESDDTALDVLWDGREALPLPRGGRLSWQGDAPFPGCVRYRRGGERIRLPGQAMHHSVKKLLSSRVPPWQRAALPFVYNEQNKLLAVGEVLISAQLDDLSRQHGLRLHWHSDSE
jgi:tRNA(Ile)-lysidine synthase